jgi:hypothetical protein
MQVVHKQNFNNIILIIPEKSVIKCELKFIQYSFLNMDTFLGRKYSVSSFLSPPPPSFLYLLFQPSFFGKVLDILIRSCDSFMINFP